MKNFWCYRIDTSKSKYFMDELFENRLRQGWGWDTKQNLRNFSLDQGAGRNRPMFNLVKKGDILLIPQLPNWGEVALVEATEDWDKGYSFNIDIKFNDFGHIFPAKYIKKFTRFNKNVENLRSTLKNPSRFWNINHFSEAVEILLKKPEDELVEKQEHTIRFESSIRNVFNESFDENIFSEKLIEKMKKQFSREEWEFALVYGLRTIFPFYTIERVGGKEEKYHGTDILIKIPGLLNYTYAIAIQVKDFDGLVAKDVLNQINKAEEYWEKQDVKLIEKIVIITKAKKELNLDLLEYDKTVRFIFASDLKLLLTEIGKSYLGLKNLTL